MAVARRMRRRGWMNAARKAQPDTRPTVVRHIASRSPAAPVAGAGAYIFDVEGTLVDTVVIAEKPADATAALRAAAQKEGGVDAVFVALKGTQARALAPQLVAAGLGDKPRVATSQLLSGTGKPDQDRALDGIVFPGETWTVQGLPGLPPADSTGAALNSARGPAAKLFAFGHDAWLLAAYLDAIARHADRAIPGATGDLRLDGFGNVVRVPAWSTFTGGEVVALGKRGD